ncbi:hypothetical protein [Streptomyces sp. NPDC048560]|uniref:hypothetical protein n=1 Tax=Streptomyces sp. NPDC048560 TaxID=3155488 RepID=UPI003429BF61
MPELSEAVQLTDPMGPAALEPIPNFNCKICRALGVQREEARKLGDGSTVSDCNIEIRRHPHKGRRR